MTIGNSVGRNRDRAVVIGCGNECVAAISVDSQRALTGNACGVACYVYGGIAGHGEASDGERIAVYVDIADQHSVRRRNRQRGVLVGRIGLIIGNRPVVKADEIPGPKLTVPFTLMAMSAFPSPSVSAKR